MATTATHRRRSEHQSYDLVRYLALFDLDLGQLEPDQMAMFIAARGAADYVEDLAIPIATRPKPDENTTLREVETELPLALTGYQSDPVGDNLPSNDMEVTTIQSVEQLGRIFPTQWLLEEIYPEAFYAKLAQRELLMPEWQRPTQNPEDSHDESPDHERIEDQAAPDMPKQHAYLLLDTSRTMCDHDRRGTVARGLALAFLLKGHQQRSQLNFRPFTDSADELSSGSSREAFCEVVRRVVEVADAGQTRIQKALEQAVHDVRGAGPCLRADVMLITDGISRLTDNPFGKENLHTFLVGDLMAEDESSGVIRTLRDWSRSFRRVWKSKFQEILTPTVEDIEAADRQLRTLADQADSATDEEAARLHRMLKNVRFLAKELKRAAGKNATVPAEVQAIEDQLAAIEKRLPAAPAAASQAKARPATASRGSARSGLASGAAAPSGESTSFLQLLKRLLGRLWQGTFGRLRRG